MSKNHQIFFGIIVDKKELQCTIQINRSGWTGFEYVLLIDNTIISEVTQQIDNDDKSKFEVSITGNTSTFDESDENQQVVWYIVKTTRLLDGMTTIIHRRFHDFADVNSLIKQNLKGHHLRSSLPNLPGKEIKILFDHRDPSFVQERQIALQRFLKELVDVPHVSKMTCMLKLLKYLFN
jgi:hypothetical protein